MEQRSIDKRKLYLDDGTLTSFEAEVLSCKKCERGYEIILSEQKISKKYLEPGRNASISPSQYMREFHTRLCVAPETIEPKGGEYFDRSEDHRLVFCAG